MLDSEVSRVSLYLNVPGVGETEPDQLPGHAELHPGGAGLLCPLDRGLHTGHCLHLGALSLGLKVMYNDHFDLDKIF